MAQTTGNAKGLQRNINSSEGFWEKAQAWPLKMVHHIHFTSSTSQDASTISWIPTNIILSGHLFMTPCFSFPCLSNTIQALICYNLHNARSNSSQLVLSLTHDDCPPWPPLSAFNPQLISVFPTGTISLSVSQLPPSPSTPLISLQPPAKWIMRSISPPRPSGLFHSLHAQPASPSLPATTRPKTPGLQYGGQFVSMNLLTKHLHRNDFWLPGSFLITKPYPQLCHFPSCLSL